ncbi:hypothetical protein [Dokdonia sinensis]|uniref:hypothetical protein n=1 Tax=Dokdonia sinensis TaxID=2479847 RepID=UPI001F166B2B|nr:hypothetical protein [Dokdonia sinensis]
MKNLKWNTSVLSAMVLGLLSFSSCETDDNSDSSENNQVEVSAVNSVATASGTWRVSSYIDDGENETSDYNGYDFTFGDDGVLTATNGTTTLVGTWSVSRDDDSSDDDGSSDSDVDFNIFFNVSDDNDFDDLNDDWDIVSVDDDTIVLIDISGGDGSTDRLTFQKN